MNIIFGCCWLFPIVLFLLMINRCALSGKVSTFVLYKKLTVKSETAIIVDSILETNFMTDLMRLAKICSFSSFSLEKTLNIFWNFVKNYHKLLEMLLLSVLGIWTHILLKLYEIVEFTSWCDHKILRSTLNWRRTFSNFFVSIFLASSHS